MNLLLDIILGLLFILLAGLLSAIEIAIASFGANKIDELKDKEKKLIPAFQAIQNNTNLFFGTIQILNTILIILSILMGMFISVESLSPWLSGAGILFVSEHSQVISLVVIIIIQIFLILIFSLLIPKAIGYKYSDFLGKSSVKIFVVIIKIFAVPVKIITSAGNFFLVPFKETTDFSLSRLSEDEIRVIISDGVKSGAIDEAEKEIIDNIFEFTDLKANEVMVPRTEMKAVELIDDSLALAKEVIESGFSLIPVYQDSLDNIIGVLHTKDFIKSFIEKKEIVIRSLIRQAYFVPETKLISEILKEMQKRGERMVIVTDEYGGTEGVITMEDILEEIIGEIKDDTKVEHKDYTKLPDGTFSIIGLMGVDDFNETFNVQIPDSEEYNTIAGFVADISGKILNRGEIVEYKGLKFELVKKIRQKMVQFKIYSSDKKVGLLEQNNEK